MTFANINNSTGANTNTTANVKLEFQGELRRFTTSQAGSYQGLVEDVIAVLNLDRNRELVLRYRDDEGDLVILSSDLELRSAIQQGALLRIFASYKDAPSAPLYNVRATPEVPFIPQAEQQPQVFAAQAVPQPVPHPLPPVPQHPLPPVPQQPLSPIPQAQPLPSPQDLSRSNGGPVGFAPNYPSNPPSPFAPPFVPANAQPSGVQTTGEEPLNPGFQGGHWKHRGGFKGDKYGDRDKFGGDRHGRGGNKYGDYHGDKFGGPGYHHGGGRGGKFHKWGKADKEAWLQNMEPLAETIMQMGFDVKKDKVFRLLKKHDGNVEEVTALLALKRDKMEYKLAKRAAKEGNQMDLSKA